MGKWITSGLMLMLIGIVFGVAAFLQSINFEQNCRGYLKRAADSNTVEMAQKELGKALKFLDDNQLTSGSTQVYYFTPDCELDFWYNNIKTAHDELAEFPKDADHLTTSNQLMKLRETIMDHDSGEKGLSVTCPPRIAYYPNHQAWHFIGILCATLGIIGCFILVVIFPASLESCGNRR